MSDIVLGGRIDAALSHFAAVGLAAILDEAGTAEPTVRWTDTVESRAVVSSPYDESDVGRIVGSHAQRHTDPESWIQRRIASGPRAGSGLFTARVKPPTVGEWADYSAQRAAERPTAVTTWLDEQMQLALGEPAWWRCGDKQTRPDDGASRWEMKTRNQGQEFLVHRMAPLSVAVAARSVDSILQGLRGNAVVDEVGKDSPASRTSTGLTQPRPVDNAVAWCALWGLHVAPTIQRTHGMGQSPGVWPRRTVHPRRAALPVFTSPVRPRTFGQVLSSSAFDRACDWEGADRIDSVSARLWLVEHGVRAMMRFTVLTAGSSSAPERQLLSGTVEPL